MKVAVASSGLGHVARGIEAWGRDLACALHERGIEVTLCKGGGSADEAFEVVVPCWQRGASGTRRAARWLGKRFFWRLGLGSDYGIEQSTFAKHLLKVLRQREIDILHVQDPQLALLTQRARTLKLVRTKTILGHGTEEPLSFLSKIKYLQHLAPWHLEEARASGVWKPSWTAIPNFIDTLRFAPTGANLREELDLPSEALVILTAAAIKREHKRIDYLLHEFARLRSSCPSLPVYLVIAGGREQDTEELLVQGRRLLGDRVRFLVNFPRERMADLYRTGDVFVLCSLKEMMPIALLEATASGLPCLVNQHPVVQWMIGPGGCAIDMAKPNALSTKLSELAADVAQRRSYGQQAQIYCKQNFGTDQVVDRILEYYGFVLAGGAQAPSTTVASTHGTAVDVAVSA
jgi:1,2-diacylglycerol 3-alpha-glucosyltransferase